MKLADKRYLKFETIIALCSFFPVLVMVFGWPMLRDSNFENLIGYAIAYITSLGLNTLGGIVAWQLSNEKTHWHIFWIVYWSVKFLSLFVSHIRYSSNLINFHKLKDFRYF